MKFNIGIVPGDGIGQEVVPAAVTVLEEVGRRFGHQFNLKRGLLGGAAMDRGLPPMPEETVAMCRQCDAVLFGAVGDPKYGAIPNPSLRLLRLELKLPTNLRPARYFSTLANRTPFKPEVLRGVDLVIIRDYGGFFRVQGEVNARSWVNTRGRRARDTFDYSEKEVRRTLGFAFPLARSRRRKLTMVCQWSVFATSKLWQAVAEEMSKDYHDVELEIMAPDNCAMQLVRNPASFDVIVNDIVPMAGMLNNLAAMLMGSVGMGPSATLRPESIKGLSGQGALLWGFGLYEPIHGSSPIHAGKNDVNPNATILSLALLLRHSLGLDDEANAVEKAVNKVLETHRTYDIMEEGKIKVDTRQMGELVAAAL
ncbi:MAG: 3-isopropylmalate dehydrogenase [Chloroflexi bacterium]|nr:3-isopropylmalate dehydrogenase [Chloroflexota bacterium]